ncbi:uncharacterized protein LOC131994746 [Stomoxys calcitrans]|uniref:uncharacterized protein LOC131994746 n=1 Tax=Stomoxys calcitrans TaxID=35570 RepID=UPI0027E27FE1|nr:uncharacterized protein LOC131994746 [Stomoxys calcitrans]
MYDQNDIFNADEIGLFGLPNKTLTFKNEKCYGGKRSKERITVLVANLLKSIRNLTTVWNAVERPETIAICFKKVGFSKDGIEAYWDEEDFLLLADLAALQASSRNVTNVDASFEDYFNVDINV